MPVTRFTSMSGCSRSILSRWWRVFWVTTLIGLILQVLFCVPVVAAANKSKAVMAHAHAVEAKNGYVGSEPCAACHLEIYQHYKETGMGQSILPITPAILTPAFLKKMSIPGHIFNEQTDRHFKVYERDGKLFQSEYQNAADGSEVFSSTHEVEWLIGAGENGFGALVRQNDFLFQAPLSFYSKTAGWGPSPGYEEADPGFSRTIQEGCIFCHAGRTNAVADSNGRYGEPTFSEAAIGCENCHGPGAGHIRTMRSARGEASRESNIVNPAKLSSYLANNICMACHQTGDVRVLKPEKQYQDFRPGEPLDKTLAILMIPPTRERPPDSDHVEHYYSMTLSKCYRASAGKLGCITCHDPHVKVAQAEVSGYFNKKCLSCHTVQSCKLPLRIREGKKPVDNCIGCHMPKRDIGVISHSSATNHRIPARVDEPFPDITFEQTTPSLRDLIHINAVPGEVDVSPPALTLLDAYGSLAGDHPQYAAAYLKTLEQLEKSQPENSLVQAALGRRAMHNGDFQAAADHLQQAVKLGAPQGSTYADLSEAMARLGKVEESLPMLEKAVAMDPFNPTLQKSLVVRLIKLKRYEDAKAALKHYLNVFPQDGFMRQMLTRAEGRH